MAITKEQAAPGTKVCIPTTKNGGGGSHKDFLYEIVKNKYLLPYLITDGITNGMDTWLDFETSTTKHFLNNCCFNLSELDLYQPDVESDNPTSYPLEEPWPDWKHPIADGEAVVTYRHANTLDEIKTEQVREPITDVAPAHYNSTRITAFQVIKDWNLDFFLGNVVKYIQRHKLKGDPLADLRKARAYLDEAIRAYEATHAASHLGAPADAFPADTPVDPRPDYSTYDVHGGGLGTSTPQFTGNKDECRAFAHAQIYPCTILQRLPSK